MLTTNWKFYERITGRNAQKITSAASKIKDTILFTKDDRTVNAASLLGLLSLNICSGDEVKISAEAGRIGDSEREVLDNFLKAICE